MKNISVAEKVGKLLISKDNGKDLFIILLETYMQDDRDDEINIDFKNITMLGHDAVEGFFETSAESSVLPPTKIYMLANFSGLTLTDINTIAKFSQNPIPSSCTIRPDYSGSCVKGIKGCNTEHPLWNRKNTVEPNVENEYFKQIQEKMSGLDIGASMNKLENILNTFESKIKDIK